MWNYRNPVFTSTDQKYIDMEVEHPIYGWIPFTAYVNDAEEHGRQLYSAAKSTAVPYSTPPEPTVEELRAAMRPLTPREFRDALIDTNIMPDQVTAAIEQIPDLKARAKALNAWEYPTQFTRTDPLVDQIGTIFGLTPEKIDKLWTEAS